MPGYRTLSVNLSGTAAEHAREAELRQRGGDPETAAGLLEAALEASLNVRPELPGWICGRLASIYRTLKRYDDEVDLLERYRASQSSEEARTRFDARLSKARAIADSSPDGEERLRAVLARMCAETLASNTPVEHLVSALKSAWNETPRPPELSEELWHERYSAALVELLALHFGETA